MKFFLKPPSARDKLHAIVKFAETTLHFVNDADGD